MSDSTKPIAENPGTAPIRNALPLLKLFHSALGLVRAIGMSETQWDGLDAIIDKAGILDLPDRFNRTFIDRGWVATESLSVTAAGRALELAGNGEWEAAENVLADAFDEQTIRWLIVAPIRAMSQQPPDLQRDAIVERSATRAQTIEEALNLWLERRYIAALPLILMAADGFASERLNYSPFAEGADLSAFDSIAGHHSGLPTLIKAICKSRKKTTWDEPPLPFRHGVLHGRDLGYGTRTTVAKAWLLLLAIVDWAKAKKDEPQRLAAHEARSKQTWAELAADIRSNQRRREMMDAWKQIEFPGPFAPPFDETSPVHATWSYLEAWRLGHYGPLGQRMAMKSGKSAGKLAGEAKELHGDIKLLEFRILEVKQTTPARADVRAWLSTECLGCTHEAEYSFGLYTERPNGDVAFPDDTDGEWLVMTKLVWDVRHATRDNGKPITSTAPRA